MNKIWLVVMIASLSMLLFVGPNMVLGAMTNGANHAVVLSIELCGIYALWSGIIKILEKTGISNFICKILSPVIDFLFGKNLTKEAKQYIALNMSANILGMGGAATPMGIRAIEAMDDKKPVATKEMIMLIVLCSTSLQFIPTSIIGLLSKYGAKNPTSILAPSIICSFVSTFVGVFLVKLFCFWGKSKNTQKVQPLQIKKHGFSFRRNQWRKTK